MCRSSVTGDSLAKLETSSWSLEMQPSKKQSTAILPEMKFLTRNFEKCGAILSAGSQPSHPWVTSTFSPQCERLTSLFRLNGV